MINYDAVASRIAGYREDVQELKRWESEKDVFIHFSDVRKLGINPKNPENYGYPAGIWGYWLEHSSRWFTAGGFADTIGVGRDFVHIFRGDVAGCFRPEDITIEEARRISSELAAKHGEVSSLDEIMRSEVDPEDYHFIGNRVYFSEDGKMKPGQAIWEVMSRVFGRRTYEFSRFLASMGYVGVADRMNLIIDSGGQPSAAVFFSVKAVTLLSTIPNPITSDSDAKIRQQLKSKNPDRRLIESLVDHPNETLRYIAIMSAPEDMLHLFKDDKGRKPKDALKYRLKNNDEAEQAEQLDEVG